MKNFIFLIFTSFILSCGSNKNIYFEQRECSDCYVKIFLSLDKSNILNNSVIIQKKIIITNPNWGLLDVKVNYYKNEEMFPTTDAYSLYFDKKIRKMRLFENKAGLHIITLKSKERKEIYYNLWKRNISYDMLRQYVSKGKNIIVEDNRMKKTYEEKDILSYEEPFSEFKRKNPELLEFLTKGDSIELEVLSPVKQKYKFKAEW